MGSFSVILMTIFLLCFTIFYFVYNEYCFGSIDALPAGTTPFLVYYLIIKRKF